MPRVLLKRKMRLVSVVGVGFGDVCTQTFDSVSLNGAGWQAGQCAAQKRRLPAFGR